MTESRWIWLWWLGQWYLIEPWYREFYLPLWPGYMAKRAHWGLTGCDHSRRVVGMAVVRPEPGLDTTRSV